MSKYNNNKVYVVNYEGLQHRFRKKAFAVAFCDEHKIDFKTCVDIFDSNKELNRWDFLKIKEEIGEITNLQRQVVYTLIPSQYVDVLKTVRKKVVLKPKRVEAPITYKADFVYNLQDGRLVVEDVKSEYTRKLPDYIMKRKLMLYIHGIKLTEII